jgi:hypothetical protein
MSKSTLGWKATTQPVSTRRVRRGRGFFEQGAAGVDEGHPVAVELLHDEAFAAEQADADLLLEGDAQRDALGGGQEGVLLADQGAADL